MLALLAAEAQAQKVEQQVAAGRAAAERWCQECHLIGAAGDRASDMAPPFAALAANPEKTAGVLTAFLAEPHPPMPPLTLTRQDIDSLVAYIRSLARRK